MNIVTDQTISVTGLNEHFPPFPRWIWIQIIWLVDQMQIMLFLLIVTFYTDLDSAVLLPSLWTTIFPTCPYSEWWSRILGWRVEGAVEQERRVIPPRRVCLSLTEQEGEEKKEGKSLLFSLQYIVESQQEGMKRGVSGVASGNTLLCWYFHPFRYSKVSSELLQDYWFIIISFFPCMQKQHFVPLVNVRCVRYTHVSGQM